MAMQLHALQCTYWFASRVDQQPSGGADVQNDDVADTKHCGAATLCVALTQCTHMCWCVIKTACQCCWAATPGTSTDWHGPASISAALWCCTLLWMDWPHHWCLSGCTTH